MPVAPERSSSRAVQACVGLQRSEPIIAADIIGGIANGLTLMNASEDCPYVVHGAVNFGAVMLNRTLERVRRHDRTCRGR